MKLVKNAVAVYGQAEILAKMKEPQSEEVAMLREERNRYRSRACIMQETAGLARGMELVQDRH